MSDVMALNGDFKENDDLKTSSGEQGKRRPGAQIFENLLRNYGKKQLVSLGNYGHPLLFSLRTYG
ncbi:hypothetical protein [Deinococcus sp. 23YEL01]|uniref:hypothetical protein n=1 Tax=Deinococcus sp. 23YEL01 TaxID=2745871 RepID=UPI001E2AB14F|nr:hypothetical protein [Deinococcus sp. 23YEL01]MCD0170132.1 hypothetical protein [Deinococcus sp. 23YEL01]